MSRSFRLWYSPVHFRAGVYVLMAVYVATMLLFWPHVRGTQGTSARAACSLVPVLPVIGVIWLMVWRILNSDELEQRLHRVALSVASGVVATGSLVGGFLGAAGVLPARGDLLIWVFPALCVVYGSARRVASRRYGAGGCA